MTKTSQFITFLVFLDTTILALEPTQLIYKYDFMFQGTNLCTAELALC